MSALTNSQPTPLRALPSILASKVAPAVPPASKSYVPLVQTVLRHRLIRWVFLNSIIFSWLLTCARIYVSDNGALTSFISNAWLLVSPSTGAFVAMTFTLSVVPVIVARKALLKASPTVAASPASVFNAAVKQNATLRALFVYIWSASAFAFVQLVMSNIYEPADSRDTPRLSPFVKSKKHPYYLNKSLVYLFSYQAFLAACYLLRNILMNRFQVQWRSENSGASKFVLAQAITSLISISALITVVTILHTVLYTGFTTIALPLLFKLPVLHRFLRPFLGHYLRYAWSLRSGVSLSLLIRACTLGFWVTLSWELAESIFDYSAAEPIHVAHTTSDPALTIVSGLNSTEMHYKYFAFEELRQLAADATPAGSAKRAALFADQKYNPSIWSTLVREALLVLGQDYQLLLRRGAPPAAAAPPPVGEKKLTAPPEVASTPLIRQNVLKASAASPLRSALESFASDGAIPNALSATTSVGAMDLPDLFRSVMAPPLATLTTPTKSTAVQDTTATPAPGLFSSQIVGAALNMPAMPELPPSVQPYKDVTQQIIALAREHLPGREELKAWWTRERVDRHVQLALPHRKLDAMAIEALCAFVSASLTEDRYGVVQRDIPRILEALLSLLSALEDYQAEIHTKYPEPTPEELGKLSEKEQAERWQVAIEVARAADVLGEVSDPLKAGVVRIVRTFGDKLGAFKFPARTARKLQGFVDYN